MVTVRDSPSPRFLLAVLTAASLAFGAPAALAGSAAQPDILDDGSGELGLPPELNVLFGWVAAETSTHFSVFMKLQSLAPPPAGSEYHYHFHFQVLRTDGNTSLYHAMVHHHSGGLWMWMVERWVPSAGVGGWGDTEDTDGVVTPSEGTIEVRVAKVWIESPRVDIAKGTWTIDSFYIHADAVDPGTGAIRATDNAPSSGTMGSYAVSAGSPVAPSSSSGFPALAAALAVLAVAAVLIVWHQRSDQRGRL